MAFFSDKVSRHFSSNTGVTNYHKGEIGIEVEVEGRGLPTLLPQNTATYWMVKNDHSLRNGGYEYVLLKPIDYGKPVREALRLLREVLATAREVTPGRRTSVHVHWNVLDWYTQEVYTAIALYFIFEPFMVAYSGPDRVGNMYCLRAKDAEYLPIRVADGLTCESYFHSVAGDDVRYSSLNLKPILGLGSLEFRSFRGTIDPQEIQDWIRVIKTLLDSSRTFNSPLEVATKFASMKPKEFVQLVWGANPDFEKYIKEYPDWRKELYTGYVYAFEIAHAVREKEPWLDMARVRAQPDSTKSRAKVAKNITPGPFPVVDPGEWTMLDQIRQNAERPLQRRHPQQVNQPIFDPGLAGMLNIPVPPMGVGIFDEPDNFVAETDDNL